MRKHDADVIIAGAGMAGTTLALALASGGVRPLLVDPQPFDAQLAPTFDGRCSAIAYSSFRQWRAIGAGEALAPHAQRIEQILVTDGKAPGAASGKPSPFFLRFDSGEIADRSEGEPLGYLIENRQIRAALSKTALDKGLEVIAPAGATGLEVDASGARVTLTDGRVLSAPLAVSAEGRNSALRKAAGIGDIGWGYGQSGVVATVKMQHPHEGVAHEYFLPSGPFAILPLTDNRASLVWTESTARGEALRHASPEAFHAHLMRRFGDFLGQVEMAGPVFVYPLSLSLAERLVAPRLALIGDAAHGVHPIAGQGLNLGLKDAAALAEVVVEAIRNGEDIGAEATLERYARWRRFDNVTNALAFDGFVRLFSNDNPLLRVARGVGMAAVNRIAPARRFFMHEAGGGVGDLPKLLRGASL
ncbi:UbiH/UbiF/VisC/COQ6 family ubiquinone biosynthesis hydroxylase [Caulobacter endophyticus]|uniref:UbiH/UbiF/VisC/COQ6 family ubiquinone biosynthesis hydroxylase n=1 Tax=Caulobacter endophyticus TaxID=2172652 RepID=UPI00240F001A|nr:UbiH/UbiF/VisC/COQ6 family ubiquinone biosynthesis hydroxylase [Caulobacter endophyticus]MDG2530361.1 UbiH/UbiF/VisC/COQ6 family ubiquinone biosynthesis hydroxylase [Caulobacter endophyticus]